MSYIEIWSLIILIGFFITLNVFVICGTYQKTHMNIEALLELLEELKVEEVE